MNFQKKTQSFIDFDLFNLDNKFNILNLNNDISSSSSSSSPASSNLNEEAINDEIAFYNLSNLINLIDGSWSSTTMKSSSCLLPKITCGYSGRSKNHLDNSYFRCENAQTQTVGFGDDVGFILNKQTNNTPSSNMLVENSKVYYFGIADGVSANRQRGYDARLFPSALLNACTSLLESSSSPSPIADEKRCPKSSCSSSPSSFVSSPATSLNYLNSSNIIENDTDCACMYETLLSAHNQVQEQCVYGSSTVCLLALRFFSNSKCLLSSCNLGDSGYMLVRDKRVLFKSQSQSHRYNAPYQIGCTPPELLEHDLYRDNPKDSVCLTHEINRGDILILSTDGLFDNLYEDEIALLIDNHISRSNLGDNEERMENNGKEEENQELDARKAKAFLHSNSGLNSETNDSVKKKTKPITNELLNSTCDLLVQKAYKAAIKRDDMLVIMIYIN